MLYVGENMSHPKPGVHERILLHLRDYSDFSDSVEVPFALSQMGIANAVSIARSNVPRAIAGLKDQGLLIEKQAHVSGVSRKRKAYFLTDSGMQLADETWLRISQHPIRIIISDSESHNTTLGGAVDVLPFSMKSVDILRYLDDSSIIDVRNLTPDLVERDLSKRVEKQLISSLADLPRLRHFYGRTNELDTMVKLLEPRSTTLIVPGIAGIGKTSLAAKLLERFTHKRNLLYHRCQDWDGARSFLEAAADWLSTTGSHVLSDYLAATPIPRANDASRILSDALSSVPSLIVIDDYHKVKDEVLHQIIKTLAQRLIDIDELVGLVIFSRSYRPLVPSKDVEGRIVSLVIPLDGLDLVASRSLLTTFTDIDDTEFIYIHNLARGHPLVLELINRGAPTMEHHLTLERYVSLEIFNKLSSEEKRLLSALAIFREPIPLDALTSQDLNLDVLDSLVEQGLARQADSENYDVHDLIREFIIVGTDEKIQRELHQHASTWYENKLNTPEEHIEYLHHLIGSEDYQRASSKISENGQTLVNSGHIELLSLIDKLLENKLSIHTGANLNQLRGDILTLQGRWDVAEDAYNSAMENAKKAKDLLLESQLLSSIADLAWKKGESDRALTMHSDALERFIKLKDSVGAARTYNNMGYIFRRQGNKSQAIKAYDEVETVLKSEEKNVELISTRINLARAYLEMGEIERAREHALFSHDATLDSGDMYLHARARAVLGRYYAKTGDSNLALHHYSEALEKLGDEGDTHSQIEISMLLGEVLEDSGKKDAALERYRECLVLAEANDFPILVGELLARLGKAAPDMQRRMDYLQRALNVFRDIGAKGRMQEVQMQVHEAIMGRH